MSLFGDKDKKHKNRRSYDEDEEILEEIVDEDELYAMEDDYLAEDEEIIDEAEYLPEDEEIIDEGEYLADDEEIIDEAEYLAEGEEIIDEGEYPSEGEEILEEGEYYAEDDDIYYAEEDYGEGEAAGAYDTEYEIEDEDEEYDEDEEMQLGFLNSVFRKFHGLPVLDKVVGLTGIIVLVCALLVGGVYAGIRGIQKQVDSFDELGYQVEDIDVIGFSGITAVTDAEIQRLALLNNEVIETEESVEEETGLVVVEMHLSSILKDLKVKFVNAKSGKLVANVPFQVEVSNASGTTSTWTDDDKDGVIYTENLSGGTYSVKMLPLEGYADITLATTASASIDVKNQIEYKKVDVEDEIKTEKEVNASVEDAQKEIIEEAESEVESKLTDTVAFVASSSSAGETTYKEIDKSTITDPSTLTSSLKNLYFTAATTQTKELTLSSSTLSLKAGATASLTATYKVTTTEDGTGDSGSGTGKGGSGTGEGGSGTGDSGSGTGDSGSGTGEGGSGTGDSGSGTGDSGGGSGAGDSGSGAGDSGSGTGDSGSGTGEGGSGTGDSGNGTGDSGTGTGDSGNNNNSYVGNTYNTATTTTTNVTSSATWTSSATSVATVSGGTVTAVAAGTATITATYEGKTASCTVTVTAADPTYTIALGSGESASVNVAVNGTTTLKPTVTTTNNGSTTISWSSSDTTIATVSSAGLVTGKKAGTATIKATCADGVTSLSYTVTVIATTYKLAYASDQAGNVTLVVGNTVTLKPTVTVTNNASTTLTWVSSDTKIATVSSAGVVTGVKAGSCTVTATCADKTTSIAYNITVTNGTVTLSATTLSINEGKTGTFTVTLNPTTDNTFTAVSSDTNVATVATDKNTTGATVTVTAVKKGTATITVTDARKQAATCTVTVKATAESDTTTLLTDKSGNQVYVLDSNGNYRKATYADYFTASKFFVATTETVYTGWQTLNGNTYYFRADHSYVTGEQVIQGAKYNFASDGSLITGSGTMGIDVSKWNGSINWSTVKNSGVSYVIIRCGYRGTSTGALIEDPKFKSNISGAISAGLKVGVYFFTQATSQVEAVEEASMVLTLINGYKISYPVFLDVESGSRANGLDAGTRTTIIDTFCKTIQSSGYTAGVYANKTWLSTKMNAGALSNYKIWLAQYAEKPTYTGRYNMWQYTESGTVSGISGKVDMNLSYLGY